MKKNIYLHGQNRLGGLLLLFLQSSRTKESIEAYEHEIHMEILPAWHSSCIFAKREIRQLENTC